MLIGAICFVPFASFAHVPASQTEVIKAWLAIWFMGIFGSVLAYLWWNRGIAQIGANRTSIFFNLVPVSTMMIYSSVWWERAFVPVGRRFTCTRWGHSCDTEDEARYDNECCSKKLPDKIII
jgi:drug/metabolite transporter (DMT)-like permease